MATAEHSPYPVFGVDVYCDLIAWNPATTAYYTDFGRLPEDRRNMMRWMMESTEARRRIPDWGEDARDVVARWRWLAASHHDARMHALVEDLNGQVARPASTLGGCRSEPSNEPATGAIPGSRRWTCSPRGSCTTASTGTCTTPTPSR